MGEGMLIGILASGKSFPCGVSKKILCLGFLMTVFFCTTCRVAGFDIRSCPRKIPLYTSHWRQLNDFTGKRSRDLCMSTVSGAGPTAETLHTPLPDVASNVGLIKTYAMSLVSRPVATKAFSSMLGYVIGDVLAQILFNKGSFKFVRMFQMGIFGALFHGPIGHHFYKMLGKVIPGNSKGDVTTKVLVDQIGYAPFLGSVLVVYLGVVAGFSPHVISESFKSTLLELVLASWCIWPLAHAINFLFVPVSKKLLFFNAVQVLHNAVSSFLGHK